MSARLSIALGAAVLAATGNLAQAATCPCDFASPARWQDFKYRSFGSCSPEYDSTAGRLTLPAVVNKKDRKGSSIIEKWTWTLKDPTFTAGNSDGACGQTVEKASKRDGGFTVAKDSTYEKTGLTEAEFKACMADIGKFINDVGLYGTTGPTGSYGSGYTSSSCKDEPPQSGDNDTVIEGWETYYNRLP